MKKILLTLSFIIALNWGTQAQSEVQFEIKNKPGKLIWVCKNNGDVTKAITLTVKNPKGLRGYRSPVTKTVSAGEEIVFLTLTYKGKYSLGGSSSTYKDAPSEEEIATRKKLREKLDGEYFAIHGKKISGKSFFNKKAPELIVEKWLNKKPNLKGKYVLIDFWATWCGPCKKAIPKLNTIHKKFKNKIIVVGVSNETEIKVKKLKGQKIEYYSAIDPLRRMEREYKIRGIPYCVVINPDGVVVWEGFPLSKGYELTIEAVEKLLEK